MGERGDRGGRRKEVFLCVFTTSQLLNMDSYGFSSLFPQSLFKPSARAVAALQGNYKKKDGAVYSKISVPSVSETTIAAPSEPIKLHSPEYYKACAIGGVISCGLTHLAVTPLDVVKCNMQTDPTKYTGIFSGIGVAVKEGGLGGLTKGWAPTLIGYSAQGACKFGFYEFFKKYYADLAGPENAKKYETIIYLAGSASAEFIADVALCPWEAVKVRVQTQPGFANGLMDGMPKFIAQEGFGGLFKGLVPLWGRQIPYTMMKFACFERTVEAIYQYVVPKPRAECSKGEQLIVTFAAGYIAGVFCAIVSHPADTIVSYMNKAEGATVGSSAKALGFSGLWAGLGPRIIMIGTLTALQWFIYDGVKVGLGIPRPLPPPMPESLKKKLGLEQQ